MAVSFKIQFPPGTPLTNANAREHWSRKARVTADLRKMTWAYARQMKIPRMSTVGFTFWYYPPDKRKRDASNVLYAASKSCIDGIVDAGVIADDCDQYVKYLIFRPGTRMVPRGQMVMQIDEVTDE